MLRTEESNESQTMEEFQRETTFKWIIELGFKFPMNNNSLFILDQLKKKDQLSFKNTLSLSKT